MTLDSEIAYNAPLLQDRRLLLTAQGGERHDRCKDPFMQELNPIHNQLKDLADRASILRGYL